MNVKNLVLKSVAAFAAMTWWVLLRPVRALIKGWDSTGLIRPALAAHKVPKHCQAEFSSGRPSVFAKLKPDSEQAGCAIWMPCQCQEYAGEVCLPQKEAASRNISQLDAQG